MRPVAIGRKNWIHVGSPQAGPKIAAILSVVESCRRLKLPVRDYLAAVLPGLADLPDPASPNLLSLRGLASFHSCEQSGKQSYPSLKGNLFICFDQCDHRSQHISIVLASYNGKACPETFGRWRYSSHCQPRLRLRRRKRDTTGLLSMPTLDLHSSSSASRWQRLPITTS